MKLATCPFLLECQGGGGNWNGAVFVIEKANSQTAKCGRVNCKECSIMPEADWICPECIQETDLLPGFYGKGECSRCKKFSIALQAT